MEKAVYYAAIGFAVLLIIGAFSYNSGKMELKSSVFENNSKIPSKYTCDSDNINPPLGILGVPENAKTLVPMSTHESARVGSRPRSWKHFFRS